MKGPVGLAYTPGDFLTAPRTFAEYRYKNIVQYTYFPREGHFTALEVPELLDEDIKKFFAKLT